MNNLPLNQKMAFHINLNRNLIPHFNVDNYAVTVNIPVFDHAWKFSIKNNHFVNRDVKLISKGKSYSLGTLLSPKLHIQVNTGVDKISKVKISNNRWVVLLELEFDMSGGTQPFTIYLSEDSIQNIERNKASAKKKIEEVIEEELSCSCFEKKCVCYDFQSYDEEESEPCDEKKYIWYDSQSYVEEDYEPYDEEDFDSFDDDF